MSASRRAAATLIALAVVTIASAQDKSFNEQNALVVVECESVPPGDNWVLRTGSYTLDGSRTVAGHTGAGCYHFAGNQEESGSVTGRKIEHHRRGLSSAPGVIIVQSATDIAPRVRIEQY
jgi:hypothetical protein